MGKYVDYYCANNNRKLIPIVNNIISQYFGWLPQKDYDDMYSIAMQTVWYCELHFDSGKNKSFDVYLTNSLKRKIKTHITYLNRDCRKGDTEAISIDRQDDDSEQTLLDKIGKEDTYTYDNDSNIEDLISDIYGLLKYKERKIMDLAMLGYDNAQIADTLRIDSGYVRAVRKKISEMSQFKRIARMYGFYKNNI